MWSPKSKAKKVQLLQKSCKVFSVIGAFGLRWEWRAAACLLLLDSFTFPTSALALGSASQTLNFKPVRAPTIPACLLSAAELWPNHILRTWLSLKDQTLSPLSSPVHFLFLEVCVYSSTFQIPEPWHLICLNWVLNIHWPWPSFLTLIWFLSWVFGQECCNGLMAAIILNAQHLTARRGSLLRKIAFGFSLKWSEVKSLSCVWLFVTPWTVACQAPLSMGFSRQEYWSGLPFSSPGDLPNPGIKPGSPELQADSLLAEPQGKSSQPLIMVLASE